MTRQPVLTGVPASLGVAHGVVVTVDDFLAGNSPIGRDLILVGEMVPPQVATLSPNIRGIVTEEGGILCHGAILAREMQVPCVVGVKSAMGVLKSGVQITVDGKRGHVYLD